MFAETIDPVHEFRHPADTDPSFNESTYYNFASAPSGVVGWLRIAIQPNQATAQATALLFLPGGEVVFAYARPEPWQMTPWRWGPSALRSSSRCAGNVCSLRVRPRC